MKKIGLLGGSFDPPHRAHTTIAETALRQMGLDLVLFIPCQRSPHKEDSRPAPSGDRLKMLELAIAGIPALKISDIELVREGLSYSIDTVISLRAHYSDTEVKWFWIMGSDQWEVLDTWHRADELVRLLEFIVFPRPDMPRPQPGKRLHQMDTRMEISSSLIRERIKSGEDISGYVHPTVDSYIRARGLYQ